MTMVIDSKQLAINGTTSLSSTAAGSAELGKNVLQLSDESLKAVPVKPLYNYEDPWPFMQTFDIWQPFTEPYTQYSPRKSNLSS